MPVVGDVSWYEQDCDLHVCNPPDGGPHVHFKIVAHLDDGQVLTNGVRLNGRGNHELRQLAKEHLKAWLVEQEVNHAS